PNLYIISGCNGSGKTPASYTVLPEMLGCSQFVNSDEFAKSFSPFNPADASISAGRFMLLKIRYLLHRRDDFCIETTLATRSLTRTLEEAKENGYRITLLYFWISSPELAVKRVRDRVEAGGHSIPEHVIRRRYDMGLRYFFNDYLPVSDRWILVDNSQTPFKVIAEGDHRHTDIKDKEVFGTIWDIAHPAEAETDG
ncbi:MAG: zeta toxin family protein, partial [Bacteroidales bacterium]|nr:zeta toxin family protein [Bacteroidales bacterium]